MIFRPTILIIFLLVSSCAKSQEKNTKKLVGGPCEGCEAIYEYGNKVLNPVDTLPEFITAKERLKITGIIYKKDGKTPAKDVILYTYQTNEKGIYPKKNASKGWEKRHGYIRGWIKTDALGTYTLYTFRPASYPNTTIPQHIHITIKEPNKNEYYIDNFYFDDDPNLTDKIRKKTNFRGGCGIINLTKVNSMFEANRDIILGKNIPNYN
jgi:protocatechuate 3,4-dioxygenase beta subunit